MTVPVQGAEKVISAFGRWPSFHDAKVIAFAKSNDTYEARLHVFEMTNQIDAKGYFALAKHHLVVIAMNGVQSSSLPDTYSRDVLSGLVIEKAGNMTKVTFGSHLDQTGDILCRNVSITSVVPCDADGKVRT